MRPYMLEQLNPAALAEMGLLADLIIAVIGSRPMTPEAERAVLRLSNPESWKTGNYSPAR